MISACSWSHLPAIYQTALTQKIFQNPISLADFKYSPCIIAEAALWCRQYALMFAQDGVSIVSPQSQMPAVVSTHRSALLGITGESSRLPRHDLIGVAQAKQLTSWRPCLAQIRCLTFTASSVLRAVVLAADRCHKPYAIDPHTRATTHTSTELAVEAIKHLIAQGMNVHDVSCLARYLCLINHAGARRDHGRSASASVAAHYRRHLHCRYDCNETCL